MICLWREEVRKPKNGVSGEGSGAKSLPLSLRIRAHGHMRLVLLRRACVAFVVDFVLKLRKRLLVSDAGGWFDFTVRRPAHFLPGFCCGCSESPQMGQPELY